MLTRFQRFEKLVARLIFIFLLAFFIVGIALYFYNRHYAILRLYSKEVKIQIQHQNQLVEKVSRRKYVRILSLDGGGLRGIIELYSLVYLEKKTGKSINKLFDVISGTSTGGIIAAALTAPNKQGKPLYSAASLLRFYNEKGLKIVKTPLHHRILSVGGVFGPLYDIKDVHKKLAGWFSHDAILSRSISLLVLYSYSLSHSQIERFISWDVASPYQKFFIHDLVASSIAVPGYFVPVSLKLTHLSKDDLHIDSALSLDNPAWDTLWLVTEKFPERNYVMLSLGTGKLRHGVRNYRDRSHGFAFWMRKAILISIRAEKRIAHRYLKQMAKDNEDGLKLYVRIEPKIYTSDECTGLSGDVHCIKEYNKVGREGVQRHKAELDKLAYALTHLK